MRLYRDVGMGLIQYDIYERDLSWQKDAQRIVADFVEYYNDKRLHSAINYITPADKLDGKAERILAAREAKLAAARDARKAMKKAS